jgi:hypothetical protein
MGLDAILRAGLRAAHALTADLQSTVSHERWSGVNSYGVPTYLTAVDRTAIIEKKQKRVAGPNGTDIVATARLQFLEPLADTTQYGVVLSNRRNPVDPRDKFTLPDGTSCPVVDIEGVFDPTTDRPFVEAVWLG